MGIIDTRDSLDDAEVEDEQLRRMCQKAAELSQQWLRELTDPMDVHPEGCTPPEQ